MEGYWVAGADLLSDACVIAGEACVYFEPEYTVDFTSFYDAICVEQAVGNRWEVKTWQDSALLYDAV